MAERLIHKCSLDLKATKKKNHDMRVELKKKGDFLEKVIDSFNTVDYAKKYLGDTQLNAKRIRQYKLKTLEIEAKILNRLDELKAIELVEDVLH